MIQKCSLLRVLEVFYKEPITIHFIREISREINLATTSVRNNINSLKKEELIIEKKSKPFNGYVANRDNEKFLFLKRAYNLSTLYELKEIIENSIHPLAIILFGSYSKGEDIEPSDIDILVLSKVKKEINLESLEKKLKRKINIIIVKDLKEFDKPMIKKIYNGIVLHGEI